MSVIITNENIKKVKLSINGYKHLKTQYLFLNFKLYEFTEAEIM